LEKRFYKQVQTRKIKILKKKRGGAFLRRTEKVAGTKQKVAIKKNPNDGGGGNCCPRRGIGTKRAQQGRLH